LHLFTAYVGKAMKDSALLKLLDGISSLGLHAGLGGSHRNPHPLTAKFTQLHVRVGLYWSIDMVEWNSRA
jgi:hypothetical protein